MRRQFAKDIGKVAMHRMLADIELFGNRRIAESACDQLQHLELARRQTKSVFSRSARFGKRLDQSARPRKFEFGLKFYKQRNSALRLFRCAFALARSVRARANSRRARASSWEALL